MLDVPPLGIRHCNLGGVCVSLDLYWGWNLSCVCGIELYWALTTSTPLSPESQHPSTGRTIGHSLAHSPPSILLLPAAPP